MKPAMKKIAREAVNIVLIIAGIFSAGFGLKGFLMSSRFIDGGVTGISMLLADVVGFPLAIWILVINLPFIALGYLQIGWQFAVKSALAIGGLALCLAFVKYPDVTPDKLLTAVFGGFFIGAGIGLAIRGGAVLDGTEIAALLKADLFREGVDGEAVEWACTRLHGTGKARRIALQRAAVLFPRSGLAEPSRPASGGR